MNETEVLMQVRDWLYSDTIYRPVLVALIGSQNYGMDQPGSDYDFKAIVLPSLEDIVFNKKPISTTIEHPFNGQVDLKDIRLMVQQWRKGAPNFLEILFTKWYWISEEYPELYWFRTHREAIAHINPAATMKSFYGQIKDKQHALTHPYPCQAEEIERHGYASKQLLHLLRYLDMMKHFGEISYEDLLDPFIKDNTVTSMIRQEVYRNLRDIKTRKKSFSAEEAIALAAKVTEEASVILANKMTEKDSSALYSAIDSTLYSIIKRALTKEISNAS